MRLTLLSRQETYDGRSRWPMNAVKSACGSLNTVRGKFILGFTISLLFHFSLLYLLQSEDTYRISPAKNPSVTPPEVIILFPENKPKQIVENSSENQQVPEKSDLLSEQNSRAGNETLLENRQSQPASTGNTPIANLSQPSSLARNSYAGRSGSGSTQRPNGGTSLGGGGFQAQDNPEADRNQTPSPETYVRRKQGTDNVYHQEDFSADQLGDLTLSTYAWEWASYVNYFRSKLYEVWRTPPAYFSLGMIHGYTVIRLTIDRSGRMVRNEVLEHQGHSSLQVSSENAVKGVFPLKPLPLDFPDQTLTLTLTLVYPNLREKE